MPFNPTVNKAFLELFGNRVLGADTSRRKWNTHPGLKALVIVIGKHTPSGGGRVRFPMTFILD